MSDAKVVKQPVQPKPAGPPGSDKNDSRDIIAIEKLSKVFEKKGDKVRALSEICLSIKRGDYIALQGPSGSGKTTLLNILGCLDRPTSGKVTIEGTDVSTMNEKELAKLRSNKIGFIFQSFNLIPIFNAIENVELPMVNTKVPKNERKKRARELLNLVGLSERVRHTPYELSAGEQQRVAIARALANKPLVILADEPTGNLDSKTGERIMNLLGELNKMGTTVVVVTHDDKMARLTKKTIRMEDGKISKTTGTFQIPICDIKNQR
ncbi:MAG: ABC transporter ATP-binding protein [Thermoplasmata archaeon]